MLMPSSNCSASEPRRQKIFQFFLSVLTATNGGLNKPTGTLFSDATTLLGSLTEIRALALIWDLVDSRDQLVCDYFTGLFAVLK
jgi:hypothetical protein